MRFYNKKNYINQGRRKILSLSNNCTIIVNSKNINKIVYKFYKNSTELYLQVYFEKSYYINEEM